MSIKYLPTLTKMANLIFILGESGSGKSSSILENKELGITGVDPENSIYFNIADKNLPVRGWKNYFNKKNQNYVVSRDAVEISNALKYIDKETKGEKTIILDDFQYVMQGEFMDKFNQKSYDKFNSIAHNAWNIFNTCKSMRSDITIFLLSHLETITNDYVQKKQMKTVGKAVSNYITPEGLVEICLYAEGRRSQKGVERFFRTNGDGITDTCKSPFGMFDLEIPNDLGYVLKKIKEFYN